MRSRFALAAAFAVVAGCHNYQKAGAKAAAVGNWKQAEAEYRVAVHKNPQDAALREQWERAKMEALNQAKGRAQRCIDERNWDCAQQEGDYAASIAEADPLAQQLKRQARTGRALHHLTLARNEIETNVVHVFDLVDFARGLSADDAVTREAQAINTQAVGAALDQANALRRDAGPAGPQGGAMLDRSIVILARAAKVDPGRVNPVLASARVDKDRWVSAEYERIARDGDGALSRHDWAGAIAIYNQAEQMRQGGRAISGIKYANLVISGDNATNARDFQAAAQAYAAAMALPDDRDRYAAAQHDRVVLRRWKFQIQSVLVHPLRPDGQPWSGRSSRDLASLANALEQNPSNYHALNRLPRENEPTVTLEVLHSDGRRFASAPVRGYFARFPIEMVIDSNAFDERWVEVRAVHRDGKEVHEIDVVRIPLKDVVSGARTAPPGTTKSILRMDIGVAPGPSLGEGAVGGLTNIPNETNAGDRDSQSLPGTVGFALTGVEATIPGATPTTPRVEILQRGAVVYRSPMGSPTNALTTAPRAVYLWVDANEQVMVRVLDAQRLMHEGRVTLANLQTGKAEVGNNQVAWAKLTVTPRRTGP